MDWAALADEELALTLQAGNDAAFDEIVRRFQGRVYAVAYRVTGSREDALDVAQETFLKAYRKVGMWQPTHGFLPWLMRLTTNQAIDHLRRQRRHRHEPFEDGLRGETAGAAVEPAPQDTERDIRAHEIEVRVQAATGVLSPTQRAVFAMRHFEGMALADIADALGCTVGSVKVHLFRALKKLQRELKDLQ